MTDVVVSEPGAAPAASRGDETTARLLEAAARVFAEKGYDGAGVAEIARRAGVTTGAIYSRFSGKAELLAAAVRSCTPNELDQLFAQHGFQGRAKDILQTVGAHLVTREPSPLQDVLLEAFVASRRDPEFAALLREQFDERRTQLERIIEIGQRSGLVDADLDPYAVVHFAQAVGLGFLLYEALDMPAPDPEAWSQVIAKVVGALDPPSPSTEPTTD